MLVDQDLHAPQSSVLVEIKDVEEGLGVGQELGVIELAVAVLVGLAKPVAYRIGRRRLGPERFAVRTDENIGPVDVIVDRPGGEGGREGAHAQEAEKGGSGLAAAQKHR